MKLLGDTRRISSAWTELSRTSYGVLNKKLPKHVAHFLNLLVQIFLHSAPMIVIRLIPKKFYYIALTASYDLGIPDSKVEKLLDLKYPIESIESVNLFIKSREYYSSGTIPNFKSELVDLNHKSFEIMHKKLREIIQWSFWTVNHSDFNQINRIVKDYLESLPKTGEEMLRRYLPQHTSNMGHLAMLFLYINYYRIRDPKRVLVLPKLKTPNSYFLDLIVKESPLKIEFADSEEFLKQSPTMIDTLHYSLDVNGRYRTESDCSFYSNQAHPEFLVTEDFKLKLSINEQKKGRELLQNYLGHQVTWFVALHVREPKNMDLKFSQARDSNISNYMEVAKVVSQLGGMVIRMGDKNFPKLPGSFPAFDYAHSLLKSEFMDVWLWSQCRLWIGTVNGAAFPPIAFGIPRILTDQWYWYSTGPSRDVVIQKQVQFGGRRMAKAEANESWRFSRSMSRTAMQRFGYSVEEVDAKTLAKVVEEELQHTKNDYNLLINQMRIFNE